MSKRIDLIGQRFGRLTVVALDQGKSQQKKRSFWICKCDCGNIKSIESSGLKSGRTQSCGCYNKEQIRLKRLKNLQGLKFGLLSPTVYKGNDIWQCQCDCGNITEVNTNALQRGLTKSCGCLHFKSIGELNIKSILQKNNINYIKEYSFVDLPKYRFDFYLPDYNRLIEFDGIQHYKEVQYFDQNDSLKDRQERDLIKNQYAISHNIPLVRIPYWERDNITLDLLLTDKYLINFLEG